MIFGEKNMQKRALGCCREEHLFVTKQTLLLEAVPQTTSAFNQTLGRYLYLPSTSLLGWVIAGGPGTIQHFPLNPGSS